MTRLLLIEDDPFLIEAYDIFLEGHGYQVDFAMTCKEAMEKVGAAQYDLILADLYLPDGDSFEVMNFLRQKDHNIKSILISGGTDQISAQDAANQGKGMFDLTLTKPVETDEILDSIKKLLD